MVRTLVAFVCGIVFGVGLAVSEMVNPAKVLAFFDVAGAWDASLAFVMAGAVAVTLVAFRPVIARGRPLFAEQLHLPTRQDFDARLIGGSAVYGVGWGLTGFCVGPSIAALAFGDGRVLIFLAALVVGAAAARFLEAAPPGRAAAAG